MRLRAAIAVERRIVANGDDIELRHVGCIHVNAPADLAAEQPQIRRQERRAAQLRGEKRHGEIFVSRSHQFAAPDETVPERFFHRFVAADDEPLQRDDKRCRQRAVTQVKQREDRGNLPQAPIELFLVVQVHDERHHHRGQRDHARQGQDHAHELDQRPLHPQAPVRTERAALVELRRRLALRQKHRRRAKPRRLRFQRVLAPARRHRQHADEHAVAHLRARRQHRAVADERPPAHDGFLDLQLPVMHARHAESYAVGDEALFADAQRVEADGRRRGHLRAPAEFHAEEPIPRVQVNRGVERREQVEAQLHQFVHQPMPHVGETEHVVTARLHAADKQPLQHRDLETHREDKHHRQRRRQQQEMIGVRRLVEFRHQHHAGENRDDGEQRKDEEQRAEQQSVACSLRARRSRHRRSRRAAHGPPGRAAPHFAGRHACARRHHREVFDFCAVAHHAAGADGAVGADAATAPDAHSTDFQTAVFHLRTG